MQNIEGQWVTGGFDGKCKSPGFVPGALFLSDLIIADWFNYSGLEKTLSQSISVLFSIGYGVLGLDKV